MSTPPSPAPAADPARPATTGAIARHRPGRRLALAAGLVLALPALAACSDSAGESGSDDTTAATLPGGSSGATTAGGGGSETTDDADETSSTGDADPTTTGAPGAWIDLSLELVTVAELSQPTALATRPGSDDLWILEREGRVRRVERTIDADAGTEELRLVPEPVLDLTDRVGVEGEGGLLGMTFSAAGDQLFLDYTDTGGDTVVATYPLAGDATSADDENVLLTVDQPFSNHNGGDIHLGPDGFLYIALGDGGAADDPDGNGQDTSTLLGTLLRIEPTPGGEATYLIPEDNPFADDPDARPEIWLYGARNPWRFDFDPATGDLWIGDVGQNEVEEIDLLPATDGGGRGANLGWDLMEGDQPFEGEAPPDHVPPIHVYPHEAGACSVTGGAVYRGGAIPDLDGVYLFSDYCTGGVAGIQATGDGDPLVAPVPLSSTPANVVSFGRGPDGELYVLEQDGRVSRIQPTDGGPAVTVTDG